MDVLCEIQKKYNEFSDKEKAIGSYLIREKDNINNISISNLAEKIGASCAAISRFSKKIGCESFVDMKINLSNSRNTSNDSDDKIIFTDIYKYYKEAIYRTNSLIDKELIYKTIDEIKSANKISIYGVGSSGLSCNEFYQRLLRMGFNVNCVTDSHMMIISSSIVNSGDLVIGISISGETKEVKKALEIAKENGAKVISITSYKDSSIGKLSDIVLLAYNTEFVNVNNFINTQFLIMYLLDLISSFLLQDIKLSEKMAKTLDAIRNKS